MSSLTLEARLAIATFAFLLGGVAATPARAEAEPASHPAAEEVVDEQDPQAPEDDDPAAPTGECAPEGADDAPEWDQVASSAVVPDVRVRRATEVPLRRVTTPSAPGIAPSPAATARAPPRA